MDCIKKYTSQHYDFYINKTDILIGDHKDIDSWVRSLSDRNILIWIKALRRVTDNDEVYFQEIAIFLTVLIRLFSLELDVNRIKLKNSEIEKLINRFEYVIKREYGFRNAIIKDNNNKYTLLCDIKKG